jgi:3-hydroxymyristoyl/3-hydroxydecanoyl-(acyl carrier protein) dehydratase
MSTITESTIKDRFQNHLLSHAMKLSAIHLNLMESRQAGLAQIATSISDLIGNDSVPSLESGTVLFDQNWLREFATGDITRCLGPEFSIYRGRRSPRIPNGDLLLVSRINKIEGVRGDFTQESTIQAEFDVTENAWFLQGQNRSEIPISILMEIALQPCGILSAWLKTQLKYPEVNFFFRNLDGQITRSKNIDTRGKTIQTRATLLKTIFSGSTIIQHFEFTLSCEGQTFLTGTTSFGYFPEETMASQVGLDGGKATIPWGKREENYSLLHYTGKMDEIQENDLPDGKLRLITGIGTIQKDGSHSHGYIYSERKNDPADWFYTNHFFEDPVMPGSLGIEAICQAFRSGIHLLSNSNKPVKPVAGSEMKWKYRGQVLQTNQNIRFDIHITEKIQKEDSVLYTGTANLWADDLRIYEIQNLAFVQ